MCHIVHCQCLSLDAAPTTNNLHPELHCMHLWLPHPCCSFSHLSCLQPDRACLYVLDITSILYDLALLCCTAGCASPGMHAFLTSTLGEHGLRRLAKTMDSAVQAVHALLLDQVGRQAGRGGRAAGCKQGWKLGRKSCMCMFPPQGLRPEDSLIKLPLLGWCSRHRCCQKLSNPCNGMLHLVCICALQRALLPTPA